jgi:Uma2 family endonuclease
MGSAARITRSTPDQYLAMERMADFKSEYDGGFITAMAGGSPEHNTIAVNFSGEIRSQLKGRPCVVFMSDVRLCVSPTGLYTYPDVMVVCGDRQFLDGAKDTLLNPNMIVEVLSDSTESYDRGRKFRHYQQLASFQEYVLVAQDEVRVERFTRQGDDWVLSTFTSLDDMLRLASIGCEVSLHEIYDKVEFAGESATH